MSDVNEMKYQRIRVTVAGNLAEFPDMLSANTDNLTVGLVRMRNNGLYDIVENFSVAIQTGYQTVDLENAMETEKYFTVKWE